MKFLANEKKRLFMPIGVPSLFLRVLLGEMATVTLEGSRISSDRLSGSGFRFQVPKLQPGVLSGDAPDQL
jgi:NAD dependent epimerase/dehydratase family enzyme